MLALPNQTMEDLQESVEQVIQLNPKHISVYSLILEEGTVLNEQVRNNIITLPDEEIERKMYWQVKNMLERSGYIHYEISNFAKKGYESKHNTDCWKQKPYIGIGLAAHSYLNNTRFSNIDNLQKYIQNIQQENYEKNIIVHENQTIQDAQKEYMLLGLRKIDGVSISEFEQKFRIHPLFYFRFEISKLEERDLIEVDLDNIKLTRKGLDLANQVFQEFV